jgi:3-oxoacyl-[acyl-carrier-protein] synthase-1
VEDRRLHKMLSRSDLFGLYAAGQAVRESGLTNYCASLDEGSTAAFNDRIGVFAGSGGAIYRHNYDFFPVMTLARGDLQVFGREHSSWVDPLWLLRHLPNNVVCHLGIRFGFKGTNACITQQCVGGLLAIAEAAAALQAGEADRAVAVGHDTPIDAETLLHYHNLALLAPDAVRPFDQRRAGTVFGEGAGAVTLETAAQAEARGAPVLGEWLGSGCVSEATGVVELRTDGEGLARAIQLALRAAGLQPADVGMIVAHANGTPASDASEAAAIHHVWSEAPPPITGFKWAYGHTIAASGALDLAVALMALRDRTVPGIPTLTRLDPRLAPLPVSASAVPPRSDVAVVLCRGFGGMNVAAAIRASPAGVAG